jgi:general secretion pathway protein G
MEYSRVMTLFCLTLVLGVSALTSWAGNAGIARIFATRTEIANFSTALKMFSDDCGRYPTTAEGLDALIARPMNIPSDRWNKYLDADRIPKDIWDHPYVYRCPGVHNTNTFDLYSCGADGKTKTGGDDPDDINNWNPSSPLVTTNVAEQLPPFAFLCGGALFLLVLIFAWLEKRILAPKGNLHGIFALLWIAVAPALWVVLTWTFGAGVMKYSDVITEFGWLPPILLWTISGYLRGTPFSRVCAVMTIPVLILAALTIPTL